LEKLEPHFSAQQERHKERRGLGLYARKPFQPLKGQAAPRV
jgi:hypothetical protein